MKALSIHPLFAGWIFSGDKTVECRTWTTSYRGELLICSTNKKLYNTIPGHALCTVKLVDVVPFTEAHLEAACMEAMPVYDSYAWILDDLRLIKPIPLKGRLGLWSYDGPIEYIPEGLSEEEDDKLYHELWEPLFT